MLTATLAFLAFLLIMAYTTRDMWRLCREDATLRMRPPWMPSGQQRCAGGLVGGGHRGR